MIEKLCNKLNHRLLLPTDFLFLKYGRWGNFRCICGVVGGNFWGNKGKLYKKEDKQSWYSRRNL